MKTSTVLAGLAAAAAPAVAQRPTSTSICDYYTTALLMENNATNQETLVTLVVNTAVIGNYTMPNVGISVPGILAPGTVNGTSVNLLPYFTGALASSNRNNVATAVNFLDDGGAAPLMMNKPANGTSSNQYRLLTHLYQYFGALLGCSAMNYPAYMGSVSMGEVHKFMDLNSAENTWFIQQVGLSAASFGVAEADVTIVGNTLLQTFNYRCAAPVEVIPGQGAQTQAICQASSCPLAANATCDAYAGSGVEPANATSTSGSPSSTTMSGTATGTTRPSSTTSRSGSATGSSTASPTASPASAAKLSYGIGAGLLAVAALAL